MVVSQVHGLHFQARRTCGNSPRTMVDGRCVGGWRKYTWGARQSSHRYSLGAVACNVRANNIAGYGLVRPGRRADAAPQRRARNAAIFGHRRIFAQEGDALCVYMLADEIAWHDDDPANVCEWIGERRIPHGPIAFVGFVVKRNIRGGQVNLRAILVNEDASAVVVLRQKRRNWVTVITRGPGLAILERDSTPP